ncbi:hypothetical protein WJX81_003559 [Elliptochloris bilobata]|uniref:Uncharacterized protein n=1 Tax=Elliptochloris bilobata TaxID=381761 RepID=A0AAW1QLQ7_9CHLO
MQVPGNPSPLLRTITRQLLDGSAKSDARGAAPRWALAHLGTLWPGEVAEALVLHVASAGAGMLDAAAAAAPVLGSVAAAHPDAVSQLVVRLVGARLAWAICFSSSQGVQLKQAPGSASCLGADATLCALLALAQRSASLAQVCTPALGSAAADAALAAAELAMAPAGVPASWAAGAGKLLSWLSNCAAGAAAQERRARGAARLRTQGAVLVWGGRAAEVDAWAGRWVAAALERTPDAHHVAGMSALLGRGSGAAGQAASGVCGGVCGSAFVGELRRAMQHRWTALCGLLRVEQPPSVAAAALDLLESALPVIGFDSEFGWAAGGTGMRLRLRGAALLAELAARSPAAFEEAVEVLISAGMTLAAYPGSGWQTPRARIAAPALQALAPATTVDASGRRVPAMLVRLDREVRSGAALLAANARLHWGGAAGAQTPGSRGVEVAQRLQAHVDAALGQPLPWAAYAAAAPRAPHTPWHLAAAELWRGSGFLAETLTGVIRVGGVPAARAAAALLVAAGADARARAAAPAPAGLGDQDSAGDAARVLRLLAPTGWLPPPLLAAVELLPVLPREDIAKMLAAVCRALGAGLSTDPAGSALPKPEPEVAGIAEDAGFEPGSVRSSELGRMRTLFDAGDDEDVNLTGPAHHEPVRTEVVAAGAGVSSCEALRPLLLPMLHRRMYEFGPCYARFVRLLDSC